MTTLNDWVYAGEQLELAREELDSAEESLKAAVAAHLKEHPLDDRMRATILGLYCEGKPFCCTKGRATLDGLELDECWAKHIESWFYSSLGCTEWWRPGGQYYEQGLSQLRKFLNKVPSEEVTQ